MRFEFRWSYCCLESKKGAVFILSGDSVCVTTPSNGERVCMYAFTLSAHSTSVVFE